MKAVLHGIASIQKKIHFPQSIYSQMVPYKNNKHNTVIGESISNKLASGLEIADSLILRLLFYSFCYFDHNLRIFMFVLNHAISHRPALSRGRAGRSRAHSHGSPSVFTSWTYNRYVTASVFLRLYCAQAFLEVKLVFFSTLLGSTLLPRIDFLHLSLISPSRQAPTWSNSYMEHDD